MRISIFTIPLLIFSSLSFALPKRSLYEFGVGGFYSKLPDYPSSDHFRPRWLLIPFIRYRGENFRTDNNGTRAVWSLSQKFKLEMSFSANFPATSEGNDERAGMDDLEWVLEIGPRIVYILFDNNKDNLQLRLPLRSAIAVDYDFVKFDFFTRFQGLILAPELQYQRLIFKNWQFNFWASASYYSQEFSDYFFGVDAKNETPIRKSYTPRAGHLGLDYVAGFVYRKKKLRLFFGVRYSDYSNSDFKDSPLFVNQYNTVALFGLTYLFTKSEEIEK